MPAMLDGPGTALVTRTEWVRVPPPALEDQRDAGAGRPGGRLQPDYQAGSTPAGVSYSFRCSSGGESAALKTRRPLVRPQPPELVTVPNDRSLQTPSRVQIPSVALAAVAKWPKAQTLKVCMVSTRFCDLRGYRIRMWESLAIRRLGVPESAGSNPAILTERTVP
jgi:hypothetical protein